MQVVPVGHTIGPHFVPGLAGANVGIAVIGLTVGLVVGDYWL